MDDVVREMHTSSGLARRDRGVGGLARRRPVTHAGPDQVARARTEHGPPVRQLHRHRSPLPRRVPPEIEEYLHYRSVDVSTIKELARRWYPGVLAPPPQGRHPPRPRRHPGEHRGAALLPRDRVQVADLTNLGSRSPRQSKSAPGGLDQSGQVAWIHATAGSGTGHDRRHRSRAGHPPHATAAPDARPRPRQLLRDGRRTRLDASSIRGCPDRSRGRRSSTGSSGPASLCATSTPSW